MRAFLIVFAVLLLNSLIVRSTSADNMTQPLFLTPLISNASVSREEIREMCRVSGDLFNDIISYSGYLTVKSEYNSNMFFWYFPSEINTTSAPVLLSLEGGPGLSSVMSVLAETGPYALNVKGQLRKREHRWCKTHHVIYLDNPVGSGFSFTDHEEGYARNMEDVADNLHEALQQLFELFEWNTENVEFFIYGESYAGKYIPALAYRIYKTLDSPNTRIKIPLNGIIIGNGLIDPLHQLQYGDFLFHLGLIDDNGLKEFYKYEKNAEQYIKENELEKAWKEIDTLLYGVDVETTVFENLTGYLHTYNYLHIHRDNEPFLVIVNFAMRPQLHQALHVGSRTFAHNIFRGENKVYNMLKPDFMQSVTPWLEELLNNNYSVCICSGQMDILLGYGVTRRLVKNLKFQSSEKFRSAERHLWYGNQRKDVKAYYKQAGRLMEVMVRNAGHRLIRDQPEFMYNFLKKFNNNKL
uniref:Carboxypeptidase n=1 Tax=Glossina austeni TaxID=7395 RepID=A0A1A9V2F1_GLOAU